MVGITRERRVAALEAREPEESAPRYTLFRTALQDRAEAMRVAGIPADTSDDEILEIVLQGVKPGAIQ